MKQNFDYIITGGGAAGRSLAFALSGSEKLSGKSVLLIEKDTKDKNDRTWCFWEKEAGRFERIIHKNWPFAWVHHKGISKKLKLQPYQYKMIRGIDFYQHTDEILSQNKNIIQLSAEVQHIHNSGLVDTSLGQFKSDWVFNSILEIPQKLKGHYFLWQHFIGWIIETEKDEFDTEAITFMDFRVPQPEGACFMYILPFSSNKALLEFTVFSDRLWEDEEYEKEIEAYIQTHIGSKYIICEKEKGKIPMSDFPFPRKKNEKVIPIGSAGGASKGSTGFTFSRIQKDVSQIVKNLEMGVHPVSASSLSPARFLKYDGLVLSLLKKNEYPGSQFFFDLFMHNKTEKVLRFLDEESTLPEELKIMSTTPLGYMSSLAIRRLFGI
jgi:lycopene beta-cyclase